MIHLSPCRKSNLYIDFKIYDIYCINHVIVINLKKRPKVDLTSLGSNYNPSFVFKIQDTGKILLQFERSPLVETHPNWKKKSYLNLIWDYFLRTFYIQRAGWQYQSQCFCTRRLMYSFRSSYTCHRTDLESMISHFVFNVFHLTGAIYK